LFFGCCRRYWQVTLMSKGPLSPDCHPSTMK